MIESMRTVCIGRFLLDVPTEAELDLIGPQIDGFDISTFDESTEEFRQRIAQREAELRAKPDRLGGNSNLEVAKRVRTDAGFVGKIFVHNRKVTEYTSTDGYSLERSRSEGVAVEALMHGSGISVDVTIDYYDPDQVDNLIKLVSQLVPNPENKIPSEPGFCIDRAYVRDPLRAAQLERLTMFARLPSHPDIQFTLILLAGTQPDDKGLLERRAQTEAGLAAIVPKFRISTLRAAERVIHGLGGDELVTRFHEENDAIVYSFWWEVNGTKDNVFVPHLSFTMETGKGNHQPVQSSLSERAALALWDRIVGSIRVRPTQQPKRSEEPPQARIGTQAWAGDHCPQSGWWLCGEGGDGIGVLGGQRQYIKKGDRMPQALLLPPQTMWEKMRGLQPSFESTTRTSWELVDKRARKRLAPALPLAQATPVAAASTSAGEGRAIVENQKVPVGSFAATGTACPASGWWRCEESHALDGTRWFAQGSLLPPATFTVPPGVFGRGSGSPRSIQRRGAWRLVRLADVPEEVKPGDGERLAGDERPPDQNA